MSRIFASLSIVALSLLSIVMFLGLRIGDYNGPYQVLLDHQAKLSAHANGAAELSAEEIATLKSEIDEKLLLIEPLSRKSTIHKLLAILAAIITILVNSIAITYFIGTNRWCKEVVQTYSLDPSNLNQSNSIKRRSFPWSFLGILTVLTIAALGAASDPATFLPTTARYVQPHFWTAMIGVALIAMALMNQYLNIHSHSELVNQILANVQQIRRDRGLEVEG